MIIEVMRILSRISPGVAILVMIGTLVILAVGLLASGIVSVKIERVDKEDLQEDEDAEDSEDTEKGDKEVGNNSD